MNTNALSPEEKQLLLLLGWFRRHYALYLGLSQERPANQESILQFGQAWFGVHLLDLQAAFPALESKKLLQQQPDLAYALTASGELAFQQLNKEETFYRYEYDNFFSLSEQSPAHAIFCERVYGENFNQHGLANQEELLQLLHMLNMPSGADVLDLGCGNGKITAFMQDHSGAHFLGLDISPQAIRRAKGLAGPGLSFEVGNMNALDLSSTFDYILSIDTLYYADNLEGGNKRLFGSTPAGWNLCLFLFAMDKLRRRTAFSGWGKYRFSTSIKKTGTVFRLCRYF